MDCSSRRDHPGGSRLYSDADERRIRRMQAHLARGLSAAEAARGAKRGADPDQPGYFRRCGRETAALAATDLTGRIRKRRRAHRTD